MRDQEICCARARTIISGETRTYIHTHGVTASCRATRKLLTIDRADVIVAQLPVLHLRLSGPRYRPGHVSILCSRRNTRLQRCLVSRAKCTSVVDDRYQRNTGCRRDVRTGTDRRSIPCLRDFSIESRFDYATEIWLLIVDHWRLERFQRISNLRDSGF